MASGLNSSALYRPLTLLDARMVGMKKRLRIMVSVCLLGFLSASVSAQSPVRIDFSNATGRGDTATQGWHEWQVSGGQQVAKKFGDVRVVLKSVSGQGKVAGQWYKAGLATGATMASDGVGVQAENDETGLQLEIQGLEPGRHTLVTYHNAVSKPVAGTYNLSFAGGGEAQEVRPSYRVASNQEAASGYLEFDVQEDQPITVNFKTSDGASAFVILNGIEIDGANPNHRARNPQPSNFNWHANGDSGLVKLSWQPAPSAKQHRLFAASAEKLEEAKELMAEAVYGSEYDQGTTPSSQMDFQVDPIATSRYYCWRVDSTDHEGNVTRGDIWSFRVRHLAFPTAEGYGRFAIGGRGGQVFKVTNLNDAGPGSLRAALEADEPRTVLFEVGGRIVLKDRLTVRNPYLTIAGQTAPGKGICISNYNLGLLGTHDCIVRFVRVRPGNTAGKTLDGMGMASTDHSIIDHCSISWTQDEAFSSRGAKNITLQRTLISEALNVAGHKKYGKGTAHGYAASIGGDIGSFHHNLLAHCAGRNWSLAGGIDNANVHRGRLDIRNNVVYNWEHRTTDGGARQVNFVNNYYKPGPATRIKTYLNPQFENPAFGPQQYYVEGNVMEGVVGPEGPTGPYEGMKVRGRQDAPVTVPEPFFDHHVATQSAREAVGNVLSDVGCNRPVLDQHDQRILEETREGTTTYQGSVSGLPGLPDSQEDVGGWEDYPEVHRSADWDTDQDGLPDWWEKREGLNPASADGDFSDCHADSDNDGYTNLEEYLNWMAAHGYHE